MPDANPFESRYEPIDNRNETSPQTASKPRVWTVFCSVLIAIFACIAAQAGVAVIYVLPLVANGVQGDALTQQLTSKLMSPPVFIAMIVLSQLALFLSAVVPARLSPTPWKERLGLVSPHCPFWHHGLLALGSLLPLAISVGAAYLVAQVIKPDESLLQMYQQLTTPWAIVFIILIGLLPGIAEELVFRGYMQRRLIDRWGAGTGILVASFIFALFHVTPHAMALAFIMGIWLGIIAYRTGAVWTGMVCHAFVNSSWNVLQVGQMHWGIPETFSTLTYVIAAIVVVAFFLWSVRVLWRLPRVERE